MKPKLTPELLEAAAQRLADHGGKKYVEPGNSSRAGKERLYFRYNIGLAAIDGMIDCGFPPSGIDEPFELRDEIVQSLEAEQAPKTIDQQG